MNEAKKFNFSNYQDKFQASVTAIIEMILRFRWDPVIREKAIKILSAAGVPGRDRRGEAAAIHRFVRDDIIFRGDVRDIETIQFPTITLRLAAGDCDDKVTLLNSLLEAVGFKTRIVTISQVPQRQFTHVYSEVQIGDEWFPMETIRPVPFGQGPTGGHTRRAVYAY